MGRQTGKTQRGNSATQSRPGGAADAEVHTSDSYGSNVNVGPQPSSFGGRNRLRSGASGDYGSSSVPGGSYANPAKAGGHSKGNEDALAGTYGPGDIAATGGIQLQDALRSPHAQTGGPDGAGSVPGRAPFEPNMTTQREMLPQSEKDPDGGPGSQKQGPEGDFGNLPGVEARKSPYVSFL